MTGFISFKNTFLICLLVLFPKFCTAVQSNPEKEVTLSPGAQQTRTYLPLLEGKKVAVAANPTSIIYRENGSMVHLVDSLLLHGVNITKVFSPEHGFRGTADAGEVVNDARDKSTGLPLVSLYGANKKPTPEQLTDVDIVIFDIQDVGVRFYTYISTLHYIMEACAEEGIPVIVLDRPNPNGSYVDGPTLEPEFKSFLGMHPIPLVHGMTIGEYAMMINGEKWLNNGLQCDLKIIQVANYNRNMPYSLPVRPSPNLPNDQSIALYPSLGLFEGTHINAGRGTEFQFQRFGAPWISDHDATLSYTPRPNFGAKDPKHNGVVCQGIDLAATTPPAKVDLQWLIYAYTHTPENEVFFKDRSFTLHAGTEQLRKQIEDGMSAEEIRTTWTEGVQKFLARRKPYLLYP